MERAWVNAINIYLQLVLVGLLLVQSRGAALIKLCYDFAKFFAFDHVDIVRKLGLLI